MNFHDLRIIVGQIKKTMRCQKCDGKYGDIDIEVIGSLNCDESFFQAFCPDCETESVIHVNMQVEPLPGEFPVRLGTAPRMEHISSNEVLDMHNFLKSFNGSFNDMFRDKEKNQNF
ncbi:MAG: hypothetical protein WC924_03410 [Candidatus Gracilibacteria bacterium]